MRFGALRTLNSRHKRLSRQSVRFFFVSFVPIFVPFVSGF